MPASNPSTVIFLQDQRKNRYEYRATYILLLYHFNRPLIFLHESAAVAAFVAKNTSKGLVPLGIVAPPGFWCWQALRLARSGSSNPTAAPVAINGTATWLQLRGGSPPAKRIRSSLRFQPPPALAGQTAIAGGSVQAPPQGYSGRSKSGPLRANWSVGRSEPAISHHRRPFRVFLAERASDPIRDKASIPTRRTATPEPLPPLRPRGTML
jgi:hypothetical protein